MHCHFPGNARPTMIGGLIAVGFGWWPVLARNCLACFFYCCQELLELVCLGCVGKLVCMVGEHLVEHENPFPGGSVIRKAINWLLFRVHAVKAYGLNEDARREGEKMPPIREERPKRVLL